MTLTEFLLERIAEDEATAAYFSPSRRVIASSGGVRVEHQLTLDASRVMAECKMKRQVLDLYEAFYMPQKLWERVVYPSCREVLQNVLVKIAAIYEDHPDYRHDWSLGGKP